MAADGRSRVIWLMSPCATFMRRSAQPSLLAIGNRTEAPGCLVEQAVNAALTRAFDDAEALLLSRLADVTLAQLSADFHKRLAGRGKGHRLEIAHAK